MASASGKFATAPITIVSTPATSAVAAAIVGRFDPSPVPPPRKLPSESGMKPRIRGLSTMMYDIVRNVTSPPRTSRPTVDPRSLILKNPSIPDLPVVPMVVISAGWQSPTAYGKGPGQPTGIACGSWSCATTSR